jgi:hypothetical protein
MTEYNKTNVVPLQLPLYLLLLVTFPILQQSTFFRVADASVLFWMALFVFACPRKLTSRISFRNNGAICEMKTLVATIGVTQL